MPNPFDFFRRPLGGLGRKIGQGVHALEDQFAPTRRQPMPPGADVNPAELDHVRSALPPSFNGTPNPATQPRAVQPDYQPGGNLRDSYSGGATDRPATAINRRPVMPMPSNIPGGDPDQYAPQLPAIAPPQKNCQHQKLDYRDEHGKRGFKEILKGGLYGMAMSGGQDVQGWTY